jgi:hypothetical protein
MGAFMVVAGVRGFGVAADKQRRLLVGLNAFDRGRDARI